MRWTLLRAYSYFREPGQARPRRRRGAREVFYGDYSYELAKERMQTAIRAHEHDQLGKQLRFARKGPRSGLVARTSALLMTLFR